jgi:hypothetical protein
MVNTENLHICLIKPHHPFQLRSRILVGMRWLNYIDSLYEDKSANK